MCSSVASPDRGATGSARADPDEEDGCMAEGPAPPRESGCMVEGLAPPRGSGERDGKAADACSTRLSMDRGVLVTEYGERDRTRRSPPLFFELDGSTRGMAERDKCEPGSNCCGEICILLSSETIADPDGETQLSAYATHASLALEHIDWQSGSGMGAGHETSPRVGTARWNWMSLSSIFREPPGLSRV